LGLGFAGAIAVITTYLLAEALLAIEVALLFFGVFLGCYAISIAVGYLLPEWKSYEFASIVGLAAGSAWIGFSLWAYSQVLPLPLTFSPWDRNAPFVASFLWLVWTFVSEIPFLVALGPPILKACYRAFPSLRPRERRVDKG
jgi:hypothetical protein